MTKKKIFIIAIIGLMFGIFYEPIRTRVKVRLLSYIMTAYWPMSGCHDTQFSSEKKEFFSQVYEDYVLSQVFVDLTQGFYVDVGANNPNEASATLYFHKKGWKGMNFEPQPALYEMLLKYRSDDINIKKAVSNQLGVAKFYVPTDLDVLGTLDDKIKDVEKASDEITVEVTTLTKEFTEHNIQEIDLLKIDVEGFEAQVIEGLDLQKFRPKVMILEYRSPTKAKGYLEFEPKILDNNYILAMDDGLNRYYYRKESPEFESRFESINKCVQIDKMRRKQLTSNI